jgi:NAD(P)-dependent dehydrogenase (short-subunit alcohol dehydrogenase family)
MAMTERIKEKVALVTGGASGFGKGIAQLFTEHGAKVYISDINVEGGQEVAKELGVSFLEHDVTKAERWEEVINQIKNECRALNILVNNAGIGWMGDVESTTNEAWDLIHKVDLDSVFYGCKYALGLMRDSGNGSIINISSISGIVASHNFTAYNSAKAAVRHLSKSVALHCARTTNLVRCNSVHPVFAKTEILEALLKDTSNDMLSKLEKQIPVRKLAEVEDIANAVLFLASDESKMITGTELVIDGGLSAQ